MGLGPEPQRYLFLAQGRGDKASVQRVGVVGALSAPLRAAVVADGSAVPSPLGVNPQLTIMSMALRAGEIIDRRLAVA